MRVATKRGTTVLRVQDLYLFIDDPSPGEECSVWPLMFQQPGRGVGDVILVYVDVGGGQGEAPYYESSQPMEKIVPL